MVNILTEIYAAEGMITRKLPVEGEEIVVRRGKKGRGSSDYRAKFDKNCLISYREHPYNLPFITVLKQKLMLINGANKCISITYNAKEANVEMPVWSRQAEKEAIDKDVVKNAGAGLGQIKISPLIYVIPVIGMIFSVVTLLVVTGRLRI